MYSIVNIILIVLLSQNIVVLCDNVEMKASHQDIEITDFPDGDCFMKPIKYDFNYMPVLFTVNSSSPNLLHPNKDGYYHLINNTSIMMSCIGTNFIQPSRVSTREIKVDCINGFLVFRGMKRILANFQCAKPPHSKLLLTNTTCHGLSRYKIIIVGFVTSSGMIPLYKICYDTVGKSPMYSWMFVNSPVNKYRQVTKEPQRFIHTSTYEGIFPVSAYSNQVQTLEEILESSFLATKYIKKQMGKHFLVPCFLTPKNVFPYIFEQEATNYYENTVPMWEEYNRFPWMELETLFRKTMIRGSAEHVIITGAHGTLTFEDSYGNPHAFYLKLPMKIKVPLYVWKMFYDLNTNRGIVFIGLNNPYRDIQPDIYFCETIRCPGHLARRTSRRDLIFCCTKDSFEKVYGELDSAVFEKFIQ